MIWGDGFSGGKSPQGRQDLPICTISSGAVSFFPSAQDPQGWGFAVPSHHAADELLFLLQRVSRVSVLLGTVHTGDVSQMGSGQT